MRLIYSVIRQLPLTLIITGLAIVIGFSDSLTSLLDIQLHDQFNVFQLFTCHLTHWSGEHLFWDVAMFFVLGALCERFAPKAFYATLLCCALSIPLIVMLSNPNIDMYRGLSGIDTGIFALFATINLFKGMKDNDKYSIAVFATMLLLLCCKIGYEFWSGSVFFVRQSNFEPLPMAHAVGAFFGGAIGLVVTMYGVKHPAESAKLLVGDSK